MDAMESIGASPVLPPALLGQTQRIGPAAPASSGEVRGADEKEQQLAKDFESVLLTKLFDEVNNSISQLSVDEDEGDGTSGQVQGLFWLYLAQDVADKGGFGMWQDIYQHFKSIEGARAAGESMDGAL